MKYNASASGNGLLQSLYLGLVIISVSCFLQFPSKKSYSIIAIVLIISLASGSRTPLAISFIIFFINYMKKSDQIIFKNFRKTIYIVTVSIFGIFVVVMSKFAYTFYNIYGTEFIPYLAEYLSESTVCYYCAFEPAIQLSFYDLVVKNDSFLVVDEYYLKSLFALLPFPTSWFDYSGASFSQSIHRQLIPSSGYSIAGNVFAEAYFHGGVGGVVAFSIGYCFLLSILNYFVYYRKNGMYLYPLLLIVTIYFVFFLHRYGLGSLFGHVRNVMYPYLLFLFIYMMLLRRRVER